MKKVWIIIGIVIVVLGAATLLALKYCRTDYEIIKYGKGQYRLSEGDDFQNLAAAQIEKKFFTPISFSGDKFVGREVWIGSGPKYDGQTVIFLKEKDSELYDVYALQGGP